MTEPPTACAFADDDSKMRARLDRFIELLLAHTARTNLTAARDVPAIEQHVGDSLALAPFVADPLVDIGSGGGFPAIPLAIATGARVTMIESIAKKATFLRAAVKALDLLGVEVLTARAEEVGQSPMYRERFGVATARAVGSVTTVLELTVPLLRVGGRALLQRGRFEDGERRALANASRILGAELEDEIRAPASAERRLLIVRKLAPTNELFPRRLGLPAKRPLGTNPSRGGSKHG